METLFLNVAMIKENATRQVMAIPKNDFKIRFEKWKGRSDKCMMTQEK